MMYVPVMNASKSKIPPLRTTATTALSSSLSTIAFTRYAFAVQYHGRNFLGFTYQGQNGEDCIVVNNGNHNNNQGVPHQTSDLRGIESVEGRIRRALDHLVGKSNYTNIQVSSRTDRGVHAWRNTFQVDIRPRATTDNAEIVTTPDHLLSNYADAAVWSPKNLVNGLNFYLNRLSNYPSNAASTDDKEVNGKENQSSNSNVSQTIDLAKKRKRHPMPTKLRQPTNDTPMFHLHNQSLNGAVRILSSAIAPNISIPNKRYDPTLPECKINNPKNLSWDVRFTATRRTYAYRILHSYEVDDDDCSVLQSCCNSSIYFERDAGTNLRHNEEPVILPNNHMSTCYDSHPFEHDRVWRIHEKERFSKHNERKIAQGLNINDMNQAAKHLLGTHDFSSFRGKGCQRSSPIVTLEDITIDHEKYYGDGSHSGGVLSAVWNRRRLQVSNLANDGKVLLPKLHNNPTLHLITIIITGQSFLYRQVRNMVACLVDVGRGKLRPDEVKKILEKKNRRYASGMAPAHGLFLVDVEHGDFIF